MYAGKFDRTRSRCQTIQGASHRTITMGRILVSSSYKPVILSTLKIPPVHQGRTPLLINLSVHRSYPRRVVVCVDKVGLLAWNANAAGFVFPGASRVTS